MQIEFPIPPLKGPDRNSHKGGKSFYLFDFDDNIVHTQTRLFLYHKKNGECISITPMDLALLGGEVGKSGKYQDYEFKLCNLTGSFRNFRDHPISFWKKVFGKDQLLVREIREIVQSSIEWKGPSWRFFEYAVHNGRPLSIITARGHHPKTLQKALTILRKAGNISKDPNYLTLYPLSHPEIRKVLGDPHFKESIPVLKKRAIHESVVKAFDLYGYNEHHQFGMSDDDPKNIEFAIQAMMELKKEFPKNSFYVFHAMNGQILREETLVDDFKTKHFKYSPSQESLLPMAQN